MSTSFHLHVDIRGVLKNQSYRNGGFKHHPDGRRMTDLEAFDALCDQLAKGHTILPLGNCDNWDNEKGCLGHATPVDT